jgi:hypothetical protein
MPPRAPGPHPSSGTRRICGKSCARTRPTTTSTGLTGRWTPLQPLPKPADLDQYHVRRQARVGGLINEYRLVA